MSGATESQTTLEGVIAQINKLALAQPPLNPDEWHVL
jgi:hypothetical protein